MRGSKLFVAALMAAVTSGVVLFVVAGFVVTEVHRNLRHDRPTSTVSVGGVSYTAKNTYALGSSVPRRERQALSLPKDLGRAPSGDIWLATFVTAANESLRPLPAARRFALQDADGHVYAPVSLRGGAPLAYAATTIPAGQQVPLPDTPAAENVAGDGYMLLFRIPRASYQGPLSLRVFDPTHPQVSADFLLLV
jgi:hypothetical protein